AILDHRHAGCIQGIEERLVGVHVDLEVAVEDRHPEALLGEAPAVAEDLVAQPPRRAPRMLPGGLDRVEHADRTAGIELALRWQRRDLARDIDALAQGA